jgi:hypothetical protein
MYSCNFRILPHLVVLFLHAPTISKYTGGLTFNGMSFVSSRANIGIWFGNYQTYTEA